MWDKRPGDKFEMTDGSILSFTEYYQQQYNKLVTDKDQPLLVILFLKLREGFYDSWEAMFVSFFLFSSGDLSTTKPIELKFPLKVAYQCI